MLRDILHTKSLLPGFMPLVLVLIALATVMQLVGKPSAKQYAPSFQSKAEVTRVIDGDTFEATTVGDDINITVRLIGIDAPESVNPDVSLNSPEGEAASKHLKEVLPKGTIVYLERDISVTDKYGRYLYYVWLDEDVANTETESENVEVNLSKMLNYQLVADGYAIAKQCPPDTKYASAFSKAAKDKK